jgi:hypothetical protein
VLEAAELFPEGLTELVSEYNEMLDFLELPRFRG